MEDEKVEEWKIERPKLPIGFLQNSIFSEDAERKYWRKRYLEKIMYERKDEEEWKRTRTQKPIS